MGIDLKKDNLIIREIGQNDDQQMASVIREVMPEFGATGPGFAIVDPAVDCLFETYSPLGSIYYVVEYKGRVLGGAGVARLEGSKESEQICELQKMYFSKSIRGHGLGQKLMDMCLNFAREAGYRACYIETLTGMDGAKQLYLKNNFVPLAAPMGETGHFKCDSWYLLEFK